MGKTLPQGARRAHQRVPVCVSQGQANTLALGLCPGVPAATGSSPLPNKVLSQHPVRCSNLCSWWATHLCCCIWNAAVDLVGAFHSWLVSQSPGVHPGNDPPSVFRAFSRVHYSVQPAHLLLDCKGSAVAVQCCGSQLSLARDVRSLPARDTDAAPHTQNSLDKL